MASVRGNFEHQLNSLGHRLLRMGSLVDEALEIAMRALVDRDNALGMRVVRDDKIINQLRYDIEEQSYTLLATQQPMATDLRRVTATISIATNMERMADHAAGIGVLARRLNKEPELKPLVDLPRMAEIGRSMLRHALDSYITLDVDLAKDTAKEDKKINLLNEQVLRELLTYMIGDPTTIRRGTYLLWVAHNLERVGDRAKNICERVVYVASGQLFDFDSQTENEADLDSHDVLPTV
jgi:phosphate transport system protein